MTTPESKFDSVPEACDMIENLISNMEGAVDCEPNPEKANSEIVKSCEEGDTNSTDEGEKEIQDNEKLEQEEKDYLSNYVHEREERLAKKAELRARNISYSKFRQELDTARLDSSLKKNTAFIKRLKNLTENQKGALEKEFKSLNLSKYMTEIAQAIVDAKLKMADISTAVHLCSLLHERYHDFASSLLDIWQKVLSFKKDEKISNLSKLRVDLRLYAELISSGIFSLKEGLPLLGNALTVLVNADKETHQNISILLTFCRYCGEDYMDLVPCKVKELSMIYKVDIPKSDFISIERQRNVRQLLKDYYSSLTKHLFSDHKELQRIEQQNLKLLHTKGELNPDRKELAENLSNSLTKLLSNAQQMAELLNEETPVLPENKSLKEEDGSQEIGVNEGSIRDIESVAIWDDEDTRAFYENLPELKALIPSILYSDSEKPTTPFIAEELPNDEVDGKFEDEEEELEPPTDDADEEVLPPEVSLEDEQEDISTSGSASQSNKILLEGFLNALPNCISRELIDSAAMEFCLKMNTRPARKKLVRSLFLVPRTRLDLLPFYSRLVATLQPLMPDMATELINMLKQDFRYQVKKKDQINIESKIKVARFIGELVKFNIYPSGEALLCLRVLLQDFNHHHIEMCCNLLETCGQYLYRKVESHHRTKIYLEQMMRKKIVKAFDPRYNTMIENAYYYVNPPEVNLEAAAKEHIPIHEYIKKLLYQDLYKANVEKILKQIRKLHWEDSEEASYVINCLTTVWNAKFYNIRCIANLLAGLVMHYDWVCIGVVDGILEDIRLGMEINVPKFNQRRIASVKYLGELYNYRIVESSVIFKVLYSFITFGVSFIPGTFTIYDPPNHIFRLHLVCTLLETCGQYFCSGASKRKLDFFLIYFQHYYLYKCSVWNDEDEDFPWQVDHLVKDLFSSLRPKLKLYSDLNEAEEAIFDLYKQIIPKALEQAPNLKDKLQIFLEENENSLTVISEEGDFEDADEKEEEELEDEEDLSELQGESLTPSQLSQQGLPLREEEGGLTGDDDHTGDLGEEAEPTLDLSLHHLKCPEDDDFMTAFDRMLSDNLLERTRDQGRFSGNQQIPMPVQTRSSMKKTYEQILAEDTTINEAPKPVVNFVLMTKTGNKPQLTNVEIPVDSELVTKLRTREEAERVERENVKRMTLEINERQEEEEAQEFVLQAQKPVTGNVNRERRSKYQHPRGVPDADLIFGPKKVR